MSDDILRTLRDLAAQGLSDEEIARALLDLTLQAAPPDVADAVRVCAIPAWFDAAHLALLTEPLPPDRGEPEDSALPPRRGELEGGALLEQIAAFSFVQPREGGGYAYHEATRARLLDWWRKPETRQRFAALNERLARHYLALAEEQRPRLSGPEYLDALRVMDAHYPNVRAAWKGAAEVENWELLRNFAYTLADYQTRRGMWKEKLTWAQAGLAGCEQLGDTWGLGAMHNSLAIAHASLPTGNRSQNLQQAINHYQAALKIATPEELPYEWATTQNNLGAAYADLPTGDRAANLEKAIACYTEALRFRTPEAAPFQYATTQNNLGNAYQSLPTGERAANLQQAIACYLEALRVYTPEAAPLDYAMTQNNLGNAYQSLPTGERAANLQQAIACYTAALRFWTPEAAPLNYAMTQNNLGNAYADLPTGDRAANLEKAIACYTEALQVEYLPSHDQAMYHRNRAEALIRLNRLAEAERDCEQAHTLAPVHPYTHARLGQLAFAREDYPAAVEHYTAAIDKQPEAGFYFDRGLAHLALSQQDQALADYQAAVPMADSITIAAALEELNEFAAEHPDTSGLDAVRALLTHRRGGA